MTTLFQLAVAPRARRQLAAALALGLVLGTLAYGGVVFFRDQFANGATWSLVTGTGGPGVLYILIPVAAAWLGLARSESSYARVLALAAIAATVAYSLALLWLASAGAVNEVTRSLLSTMAVSLLVGGVGAVAIRGVIESTDNDHEPGHG